MVLQLIKGYEALKPIVERVMEKPTTADVNTLHALLRDTAPQALEKLQDFILAHLMKNVIDPNLNAELKCSILQCVHTVLENSRISSAESVLRLLSFLFSQVFDSKQPTLIRQVPEELKLNIILCALALSQNISEAISVELYKSNHVPALSQAVYICVTLAKHEMLQDLRVSSMEVVMALSLIPPIGDPDSSDPQDRKIVADAVQFMLPGIVSNLTSVLQGPITQSSKITATAVRTLGGVIALVMEDYDWGASEHSADTIVALVKSTVTENNLGEKKDTPKSKNPNPRERDALQRTLKEFGGRTKEWRKDCATKLIHALEEIGKLQTHPHWRVRREVVWVSSVIITRCPQSLYEGLSPLLNALLHLKGDDQPEIRHLCLQSISEIQDIFAARACKSFKELVKENMYSFLSKLPRLVQEDCGANTPTLLSLLAGYIELLDSDLKLMLFVAAHLQRFCLAVLQALVLDTSFVVLMPEYSSRELKAVSGDGLRAPWVRFEHCGNEAALDQISRFVRALCTSDACEIIGRQLLAFIAGIPSIACEAALFLNQLLRADKSGKLHHLAILALDLYLNTNVSVDFSSMSLTQSQKNIVKICILTEGVGCCIGAMKQNEVNPSLLRGIYPVVERAGSANYLIATAGLQGLSLLSNATGHGGEVLSFLNANMDYLSHSLSIRLRRAQENPAVFDALTLLLRHTSQDNLPGIRDIVNDVLIRNRYIHHENYAEAHLRVFHAFAVCMIGWLNGEKYIGQEEFENDDDAEIDIQVSSEDRSPKWQSVNQLLDYHANLLQADQDIEMEDDSGGSELLQSQPPHVMAEQQRQENEETKEEEKPPAEVLLLESVVRRSLHFITSHDIHLQFLALRTVTDGIKALSAFKGVLLPLAHQTWAPLVGRLRRNQPPLIFRTAFSLLCTMADTCQDFLRPRIVKEILPEVCNILQTSAEKSHLQDKNSAHRFSQLYKLQKAILSRVGHLCLRCQLEGPDFRPLLIAALPYLSCYQPRPLQKYCFNFVSVLKSLDDDLVWWNVATFWGSESLTSVLKVPPGNTDFCSEISILLEHNRS